MVQDLDLPPCTAFGVEFGMEGRFLDYFEGKSVLGCGVCVLVVYEEDCSHGSFAEDFDGSNAVKV